MLLERAAPSDLDRARNLLKEALAVYTRIGMPRHGEIVSSLLAASSASAPSPTFIRG